MGPQPLIIVPHHHVTVKAGAPDVRYGHLLHPSSLLGPEVACGWPHISCSVPSMYSSHVASLGSLGLQQEAGINTSTLDPSDLHEYAVSCIACEAVSLLPSQHLKISTEGSCKISQPSGRGPRRCDSHPCTLLTVPHWAQAYCSIP